MTLCGRIGSHESHGIKSNQHYGSRKKSAGARESGATGRDVQGGCAEFTKVLEDFAYRIPHRFTDSQAAPLLCAGAIGYRSLHLTGIADGDTLGLSGFGASASTRRRPGSRSLNP